MSSTPRRVLLSLLVSFCLLFALFSFANAAETAKRYPDARPSIDIAKLQLHSPESYEELFAVLENLVYVVYDYEVEMSADAGMESATTDAPMPMAATGAAMEKTATDYSGTNVQVEGVDEADIIKTDGNYIYRMTDNAIHIFRALGADTTEVAVITYSDDDEFSDYTYLSEIYVSGNRLIVLRDGWSYDYNSDELARYISSDKTYMDVYDISDRTAPTMIASFAQDGSYETSRLMNGMLYTVSNGYFDYYYYSIDDFAETDPSSYVPAVYGTDGVLRTIALEDIYIPNEEEDIYGYTTISQISLEELAFVAEQSVVGNWDTVYMNENNLYLASTTNEYIENEPYYESVYEITENGSLSVLNIARWSLADNDMNLEASTSVIGRLINQFAMDEYDGHLRLVATDYSYYSRTFYDPAYDLTFYKSLDTERTSTLYVLDMDLNTVGMIDSIAPGERIYSARFVGDVAYFVTFVQTDPLFCADLSDPENPVITSELVLPGFSQYLHVYGDGLLFGFGQATDEQGFSDGLKLSMFDTSDPFNLMEIDTLPLEDEYYSEAQYNHKAVLISPERNIIGLPFGDKYRLFGFTDGKFFEYELGSSIISLFDEDDDFYYYGGEARGLFIEDVLYLCDCTHLKAYDMNTFEQLLTLKYAESEPWAVVY